jgi:hypothetical protein
MALRQTPAERDTVDSAWHEAGHAAAAIALGMPLSSVWVIPERATVGKMVGRTQLDAGWLIEAEESDDLRRRLDLQSLAGDVVDMQREATEGPRLDRFGFPVRRRIFTGAHVLEVHDRYAEPEFRALLADARALIDTHWPMVETIATALLASPDLGLYGKGIPGNVLYRDLGPPPALPASTPGPGSAPGD